jgi:hypothetical protein
VARLLLDNHANPNARNCFGATPLHLAAWQGQKGVATVLLLRGALVNAPVLVSDTTLHLAAEIAKQEPLIKEAVTWFSGMTPLYFAAGFGNKELVMLLLAYGADVNARNKSGQTPLQAMMQASELDAATKASIAPLLQNKPKAQAGAASPPATTPARPSSAAAQPTTPNYCDVGTLVRALNQAAELRPELRAPGTPGMNPALLPRALEEMQIALGCRQPPQTTECRWIGNTWTCKTQ